MSKSEGGDVLPTPEERTAAAEKGRKTFDEMLQRSRSASEEQQRQRREEEMKANELAWRALREHDHKYAYYKLTIAGAALVFALNQTRDARLSWYELPLAFAVLSWASSFAYGLSHLKHVRTVLIMEGDPFARFHGASRTKAEAAVRAGDRQLGFLIIGGFLYVVWHIIEMYLRTRVPR